MWIIDNYEGERVDVADQSTEELQRIRGEVLDDIQRGSMTPRYLLEETLDIIDEELEARS